MTITNGEYARVHDWQADATNSVPISADRMDAEFDGVRDALNVLLKQDVFIPAARVGGTYNAITITPQPATATHIVGSVYSFVTKVALADSANVNVTLAVSGRAALPVHKSDSTNLTSDEIPMGTLIRVIAITNAFMLISAPGAVVDKEIEWVGAEECAIGGGGLEYTFTPRHPRTAHVPGDLFAFRTRTNTRPNGTLTIAASGRPALEVKYADRTVVNARNFAGDTMMLVMAAHRDSTDEFILLNHSLEDPRNMTQWVEAANVGGTNSAITLTADIPPVNDDHPKGAVYAFSHPDSNDDSDTDITIAVNGQPARNLLYTNGDSVQNSHLDGSFIAIMGGNTAWVILNKIAPAILRAVVTSVGGDAYALRDHNHDDRYPALNHNHDDRYVRSSGVSNIGDVVGNYDWDVGARPKIRMSFNANVTIRSVSNAVEGKLYYIAATKTGGSLSFNDQVFTGRGVRATFTTGNQRDGTLENHDTNGEYGFTFMYTNNKMYMVGRSDGDIDNLR